MVNGDPEYEKIFWDNLGGKPDVIKDGDDDDISEEHT